MNKNILHNAISLLLPAQKKRGPVIISLLCINSLLDFFSVAAFFPLLILVINPSSVETNVYLKTIYTSLKINSTLSFAVALTIGIVLFILLKIMFNTFVTYKKASFAYEVGGNLASRVVNRFQQLSYFEYTHSDAAHELNRIANLPIYFANNILIPAGTFLSEALVSILLIGAVALYNTKIFIFLILVLLPLILLYQMQRKRLMSISNMLKKLYPLHLKYATEIINGYPDIKSFQRESHFHRRFISIHKLLGKTFSKDHTLHSTTIRLTELLAAVCICTLIVYSFLINQNPQQTIMILSLYAGASFRVIPSINRIFSSILQIKANEYVIQELTNIKDFTIGQNLESTPVIFNNKIELREITFSYPKQNPLFTGLSLVIKKGEKIALTGKSGEGKTTLLLILLQFIKTYHGKIIVDDSRLDEKNSGSWQDLIGYVPQNPYIQDASVAENVAFGIPPNEIDLERVATLISEVDLTGWVAGLSQGLNSNIGEKGVKISGGQRQRLAIARALYRPSQILLLDEITNQLDADTEKEIIHILQKLSLKNKTIIVITHHIELMKQFDTVYEMKNGLLINVNMINNTLSHKGN